MSRKKNTIRLKRKKLSFLPYVWSPWKDLSLKNQFCLPNHATPFSHLLWNVKLFLEKKVSHWMETEKKKQSTIQVPTSHEVHCMKASFVSFHLMIVIIFRERISYYEMIIAWKCALWEAKLISGASFSSSTSDKTHESSNMPAVTSIRSCRAT